MRRTDVTHPPRLFTTYGTVSKDNSVEIWAVRILEAVERRRIGGGVVLTWKIRDDVERVKLGRKRKLEHCLGQILEYGSAIV